MIEQKDALHIDRIDLDTARRTEVESLTHSVPLDSSTLIAKKKSVLTHQKNVKRSNNVVVIPKTIPVKTKTNKAKTSIQPLTIGSVTPHLTKSSVNSDHKNIWDMVSSHPDVAKRVLESKKKVLTSLLAKENGHLNAKAKKEQFRVQVQTRKTLDTISARKTAIERALQEVMTVKDLVHTIDGGTMLAAPAAEGIIKLKKGIKKKSKKTVRSACASPKKKANIGFAKAKDDKENRKETQLDELTSQRPSVILFHNPSVYALPEASTEENAPHEANNGPILQEVQVKNQDVSTTSDDAENFDANDAVVSQPQPPEPQSQEPTHLQMLEELIRYQHNLSRSQSLIDSFIHDLPDSDAEGGLDRTTKNHCLFYAKQLHYKVHELMKLYNTYMERLEDVLEDIPRS